MTTLIVSVPVCISRNDFYKTWGDKEFATESDFNEAWEAYLQDNLEEAEICGYDEDYFEAYTISEVCTLLNDEMFPDSECWFAPVHIG